jgi:hypothetical protein
LYGRLLKPRVNCPLPQGLKVIEWYVVQSVCVVGAIQNMLPIWKKISSQKVEFNVWLLAPQKKTLLKIKPKLKFKQN